MVTKAKRASNNKWDANNMVVLGCKIKKDKALFFKKVCRAAHTTPNAVFSKAIDRFMQEHEEEANAVMREMLKDIPIIDGANDQECEKDCGGNKPPRPLVSKDEGKDGG